MALSGIRENLFAVVSAIPSGKVMGYGDVGSSLDRPCSGLVVGKMIADCPPGVPWWRVVGANGDIKTDRRDPRIGMEQRALLASEDVHLENDRVPRRYFVEQE